MNNQHELLKTDAKVMFDTEDTRMKALEKKISDLLATEEAFEEMLGPSVASTSGSSPKNDELEPRFRAHRAQLLR